MCAGTHVCTCMWRPEVRARRLSQTLSAFPLFFLDTESLGELHLESLASMPWGSSCLHLPHVGATGACCRARLLDTAAGGLGSASPVGTASTVLIPSPWFTWCWEGNGYLGVLCQAWPFPHLLPGCHMLSALLFHKFQLPLEPALPW